MVVMVEEVVIRVNVKLRHVDNYDGGGGGDDCGNGGVKGDLHLTAQVAAINVLMMPLSLCLCYLSHSSIRG